MSLRLRILQIDVPAAELAAATWFWSGALSADPVDAPGASTHLVGATSVVEVHLQARTDRGHGYHLDLEAADREGEVSRLVQLGGREIQVFDEGYTVVADPSGLHHCVIDPDAAVPTPIAPRRAGCGHLDAIFLDVPATEVDAEVSWWSAALDTGVARRSGEEAAYTGLTGVAGPGGAVSLEVQAVAATPRVHVDLSAVDVAAEVERLLGLGATHVADIDSWVTLADPVGNLLCIVPARDEPDAIPETTPRNAHAG